jgi:hypothetical protein
MKFIVVTDSLVGTSFIASQHRTLVGAMDSCDRLLKRNPALRPKIYQGVLKARSPREG